MLINNPVPAGEYRHNYVRLGFLVGTLLLFVGHIVVHQYAEQGHNYMFPNATSRPEDLVINDITPSNWVYRGLDALNYFWQLSWLLYTLSLVYRRSANGYLYVSPNTLTPVFFGVYTAGFLVQTLWLLYYQQTLAVWSWIIYLISFLLLSLALFIINNNVAVNRKLYETEGFLRDVWFLRFLVQNGVAFFASWTAVRFVLTFNTFLQFKLALSVVNAGTIALVLAAILAAAFFFGANFNATLVERCAYQFSPWLVFIFFFWGVVENNWVPKNATRNNIIAAIELVASIVSAIAALALFALRYRASKIDPIA